MNVKVATAGSTLHFVMYKTIIRDIFILAVKWEVDSVWRDKDEAEARAKYLREELRQHC